MTDLVNYDTGLNNWVTRQVPQRLNLSQTEDLINDKLNASESRRGKYANTTINN